MEIETVYIIVGIVGIVNTICFWVLCINVAKIKKSVAKSGNYHQNEFEKHLTFGDKEAAKEVLKEMIWMQFVQDRGLLNSKHQRKTTLKIMHSNFDPLLKKVDMDFPEEPSFIKWG